MTNDARKAERLPIVLVARYREPSMIESREAEARDLSLGGMFVATARPSPRGALIRFECSVADEGRDLFRGTGRVVWQRGKPDVRGPAGMGVRFVHLEPGGREAVARLAEQAGKEPSQPRMGSTATRTLHSAVPGMVLPVGPGPSPTQQGLGAVRRSGLAAPTLRGVGTHELPGAGSLPAVRGLTSTIAGTGQPGSAARRDPKTLRERLDRMPRAGEGVEGGAKPATISSVPPPGSVAPSAPRSRTSERPPGPGGIDDLRPSNVVRLRSTHIGDTSADPGLGRTLPGGGSTGQRSRQSDRPLEHAARNGASSSAPPAAAPTPEPVRPQATVPAATAPAQPASSARSGWPLNRTLLEGSPPPSPIPPRPEPAAFAEPDPYATRATAPDGAPPPAPAPSSDRPAADAPEPAPRAHRGYAEDAEFVDAHAAARPAGGVFAAVLPSSGTAARRGGGRLVGLLVLGGALAAMFALSKTVNRGPVAIPEPGRANAEASDALVHSKAPALGTSAPPAAQPSAAPVAVVEPPPARLRYVLDVSSEPAGASVRVAGRSLTTPARLTLDAIDGPLPVTAELVGRETVRVEVQAEEFVPSGDHLERRLLLRLPPVSPSAAPEPVPAPPVPSAAAEPAEPTTRRDSSSRSASSSSGRSRGAPRTPSVAPPPAPATSAEVEPEAAAPSAPAASAPAEAAPQPAAEPEARPPSALEQARACLLQGDNACAIRALEGRQGDAKETELLIETYRAMGETEKALPHVRRYVSAFPNARKSAEYQHLLERAP